MNDLSRFPTLEAIGHQLAEAAERDAARHRTTAHHFIARWAGLSGPRRMSPILRLGPIVPLVLALAACAYAVPATRAALDDVYGSFADWVDGGSNASAPGRAIAQGDDLPSWLRAEDGEKRVLAVAGGERLVAVRDGHKLTFGLAGFGTTGTIESLRQSLSGKGIVLIGPGRFLPDGRHDRRPLFGLVSRVVARVRFNYADGTSAVRDSINGAFGIVIDTDRRPASVSGYDKAGHEVARLELVTDPRDMTPDKPLADFRFCPDTDRECPPWTS